MSKTIKIERDGVERETDERRFLGFFRNLGWQRVVEKPKKRTPKKAEPPKAEAGEPDDAE